MPAESERIDLGDQVDRFLFLLRFTEGVVHCSSFDEAAFVQFADRYGLPKDELVITQIRQMRFFPASELQRVFELPVFLTKRDTVGERRCLITAEGLREDQGDGYGHGIGPCEAAVASLIPQN